MIRYVHRTDNNLSINVLTGTCHNNKVVSETEPQCGGVGGRSPPIKKRSIVLL